MTSESVDETENRKRCCTEGSIRIISGTLSMLFGGAFAFSATLWFANIQVGFLSRRTCAAFAFGILCGIFQFGSTQILCLMGLKSKWKLFVWFTIASFVGSAVVFITSLLVRWDPEAPNAADVQYQLLAVIVTSGLNCVCTGILVVVSFLTKVIEKVSNSPSVPYSSLDQDSQG